MYCTCSSRSMRSYLYTKEICSLVPRPPPQLLSLAVRKSRRRPGRVSHVMRAAAYVTDSVNTYSQYSTGYRLFQRRYRDQTNSRGEAGPTYTTYLDLQTKPLRDGCNTMVITSKRMKRFDCSLRHCSGKYNTCSSALLRR